MELGYFSKQMNHQYKIFEHESEYLEELLGAKVATGTSVCRHMSSFMADVMNELGYTAANISCTINKEDPIKQLKKRKFCFKLTLKRRRIEKMKHQKEKNS